MMEADNDMSQETDGNDKASEDELNNQLSNDGANITNEISED